MHWYGNNHTHIMTQTCNLIGMCKFLHGSSTEPSSWLKVTRSLCPHERWGLGTRLLCMYLVNCWLWIVQLKLWTVSLLITTIVVGLCKLYEELITQLLTELPCKWDKWLFLECGRRCTEVRMHACRFLFEATDDDILLLISKLHFTCYVSECSLFFFLVVFGYLLEQWSFHTLYT